MNIDPRYVVEVRLLDSMNRVRRSRVIGVFPTLEKIPVNEIRLVNEKHYPNQKIDISIVPVSDLELF